MSRSSDPHTARSSRWESPANGGDGGFARSRLGGPFSGEGTANQAQAGDPARQHLFHGIDAHDLIAEYQRRGLDELSDTELCQRPRP